MDPILRKHIVNTFKLSGLTLRSEACNFLLETLMELDPADRDDWIEKIIDYIQRQTLLVPVAEKKLVEAAILDSCKNELDEEEDILWIVSAFNVPRFKFNVERKKFLPVNDDPQLFDSALCKGRMFRHRYDLIHQFTVRNSLFNDLALDGSSYKLKPIESLLSTSSRINNIVILGLLTHLKEGQYYLEDPTGTVAVDLSQANYHDGLFTDGSFVLAEGSYKDEAFIVQAIGLPPRESAELSRTYFSSSNYFGGPSESSLRFDARLKKFESHKEDAMFVFLSDIWLDQPQVLEKLDVLFTGYSNDPPFAFVLMGDFLSCHKGISHYNCIKEGFRSLADLISQYPSVANHSRFIIVPGPNDSPAANILPRPELARELVSDLLSVVKFLSLATNPCRVQYCTQEMVLLREDIVTKLCRNTIHYPTSKDIGWHFARTVVCQGSLVPLSLNVCPVYWSFSSSLDIYPCPDLLVVGDRQKPFSTLYNKCNVINPGSFSKGQFAFKVYYPASRSVDDCQISNGDDTTS